MAKKIDTFLQKHPVHAAESKSRSRSLGPRSSDFKKRKAPDDTDRIMHFDFLRMRNETLELYEFLKWIHGDAESCSWDLSKKYH
jgi:hypothetical protein